MSSRLFLLLSVIFAFLQGTFLPVVFIEGILLIFLGLSRPSLKVSPFILLAGLSFDIAQNNFLGETSLLFLISIFLLHLLKEQIQIQKALILSLIAAVINAVRWQLVAGYLDFWALLISFLLSFIVLSLFWHPVTGNKLKI